MKIILLGNIGVGKSTIADAINNKWNESEILSIDNIRKKYGDSSIEKENYCKQKFIESVTNDNTFQIIELSGVGILGEQLFSLLKELEENILVIYLYTSESTLNRRNRNRNWDTPFPLPIDKIPDAIYQTEQLYKEGLLDKLMNICKNAFYVSLENSDKRLETNLNLIENIVTFLLYK